MFDNIFGIHEQALLLHGQRLGVLAANIANVDTPNYKARDIDFAAVLGNSDGETPLPVTVTDAAHIVMTDGGLPAGGNIAIPIRHRSTAIPLKCRWSKPPSPRTTCATRRVSRSSTARSRYCSLQSPASNRKQERK
jgi:hypothetical protein